MRRGLVVFAALLGFFPLWFYAQGSPQSLCVEYNEKVQCRQIEVSTPTCDLCQVLDKPALWIPICVPKNFRMESSGDIQWGRYITAGRPLALLSYPGGLICGQLIDGFLQNQCRNRECQWILREMDSAKGELPLICVERLFKCKEELAGAGNLTQERQTQESSQTPLNRRRHTQGGSLDSIPMPPPESLVQKVTGCENQAREVSYRCRLPLPSQPSESDFHRTEGRDMQQICWEVLNESRSADEVYRGVENQCRQVWNSCKQSCDEADREWMTVKSGSFTELRSKFVTAKQQCDVAIGVLDAIQRNREVIWGLGNRAQRCLAGTSSSSDQNEKCLSNPFDPACFGFSPQNTTRGDSARKRSGLGVDNSHSSVAPVRSLDASSGPTSNQSRTGDSVTADDGRNLQSNLKDVERASGLLDNGQNLMDSNAQRRNGLGDSQVLPDSYSLTHQNSGLNSMGGGGLASIERKITTKREEFFHKSRSGRGTNPVAESPFIRPRASRLISSASTGNEILVQSTRLVDLSGPYSDNFRKINLRYVRLAPSLDWRDPK